MINNKPLITIITPTYNRRDLLENAILSVINQKFDVPFDREMIITDDGSKDGTKEHIQKHLDQYKNIKYFYQENAGVGKARNNSLQYMSKDSDYTILLDSDDEFKLDLIDTCLKKRDYIKKEGKYDAILGFYFLCEDESGRVVGNKKILGGKQERHFDYLDFLKGEINVEMGILLKSHIFLDKTINLRFPEHVITETVMWSKMRQYMDQNGLKILLRDYVGRFYRLNHSSEQRICKTISPDRFKKNAVGNLEVLNIIHDDLEKLGLKKVHADYLFRIGINYVLAGEKKEGLKYIKKSLKKSFNIIVLGVYILSLISRKLVSAIHKLYI